jgi:putative DNA primase/helicase
MRQDALELARGRWPQVLAAAGIDERYLRLNKSGPCPLCGGNDRYSYCDKNGDGRWVCRSCTGGYASGIDLLARHLGRDFRGACDWIREWFGGESPTTSARPYQPQPSRDDDPAVLASNAQKQIAIWNAAKDIDVGDPAHTYLVSRIPTLNCRPQGMRWVPDHPYYTEGDGNKPRLVGRFPCIVSRRLGVCEEFAGLHFTYLAADGSTKASLPDGLPAKKNGRKVGQFNSAVRLLPLDSGSVLGIAEGIETALAAAMQHRIPVWAALNARAMEAFRVPELLARQVKTVIIFADSDAPDQRGRRAGQEAARTLASNLRLSGHRTRICMPAASGHDFADYAKS